VALALGLAAGVVWYLRSGHGRTANSAWLAAAGVAFGLAVVERANLLLLLPAVGAWLFALASTGRRMRSLVALAAGAAIPLGLVLTLNVAGSGQWVPLTTSGGINLSLGFHDGASGTYDEPWERESPEFSARHTEPEAAMTAWASSRTGRALDPRQASAYWTRQALGWIGAHPGESLRLVVRKAALMLNDAEIANHLDFVFIREHAPALRLMPVGFGLVLMGAVFGAGWTLLSGPRRAVTILMLLAATAAFASVLPFTVADRYRAPMLPPLLVLAGAGVTAMIGFATDPARRHARGAWLPLVAGVLVFALARIPLARPERARDWWMFAEAWETKGNLPAAVAAYETALAETPAQVSGEAGDRAELLNNLGEAYRRMGDRERAIACLRRAIAAEPRLAYPHQNLGMLLIAGGHRDEALRELNEADRLAPDDPQVLGAIGALEAERGDRAAADRAFARAKALAPTDPRLERLIRDYTPRE
jgi:4-amino-4-deoxy-L-arabinose transferase-like glycosyltransferase